MLEYLKLIILQYADKPHARGHVATVLKEFQKIYDLANFLNPSFDLDTAVGKQLDIIGKIVGISRNVPFLIPKKYFGFFGFANSHPFDNKFLTKKNYPFKRKYEIAYTDGQLNDNDYRFFIRAKILKNYARAVMIGDYSLQKTIDFLFLGLAYVVDNKDMTLTLYINPNDVERMRNIRQLDLLPRPQAVEYKFIISYNENNTFGFYSHNKGFGNKFLPKIDSFFAIKV